MVSLAPQQSLAPCPQESGLDTEALKELTSLIGKCEISYYSFSIKQLVSTNIAHRPPSFFVLLSFKRKLQSHT